MTISHRAGRPDRTVLPTTTHAGGPLLRRWTVAHPVAAYALLAYALSWVLWSPSVLGAGGPVVVTLFFLGVLGPATSALIVSRVIGAPVRPWAAQLLNWRVPIRYYLYALGLPALLLALVNLELLLLGRDIDLHLLSERLPAYAATFALVLTVGGGLEEPGWRGFALPRLQDSHTPVRATLILGVIWGIWHLPLYGVAFLGPMLFVFFYTWLYNRTRSVLLCVLLHASFTPALDHLVLREDSVAVDLAILLTLVAGTLLLVGVTRGRLGRPDDTPSTAGATDGPTTPTAHERT